MGTLREMLPLPSMVEPLGCPDCGRRFPEDPDQALIAGVECPSCRAAPVAHEYEDEIVTRSAPRWAWDLIDETLAMDSKSRAFDQALRERIGRSLEAMVAASEDPDLEYLSEEDVGTEEGEIGPGA